MSAECIGDPASNDVYLLDLLQKGDVDSLASIHKLYSKLVYSVALRMLREPSLAEDVHQEIFLQLWQSSSKPLNLRGSLGGWLTAVSRNRSIDLLRKRKFEQPIESLVVTAPGDLFSECDQNIMLERISAHIALLSAREQQLLKLVYVEGWTQSEIAKYTGLALGTVKTTVRNALIALRGYTEN